jgi:hypothetical protein
MELNPTDSRHWPFIGSVVDYLGQQGRRRPPTVPQNVALPWPFSTRRVGEVARAGPYAAFLGGAYNPTWTEFRGKATRNAVKTLQDQKWDDGEPYRGISPDGRFELATATDLPADVTLDRLDRRRSLVEQFDRGRRDLAQRRGLRPRPAPRDGLQPYRLRKGANGPQPRPRAPALRELRHDGLRPGGAGARRLVEAGTLRDGLLGRVRPGRLRLGHALGPLPA